MLDLQHGLARNRLSSFSPVCQSDGTTSTASTQSTADFDFWGERKNRVYDSSSGHGQVEFDDDYGACSPRFWTTTSPLLTCNHCYSYPSPKSRLQAIIDGRRELMEMIKDLPESSYELSLKDIVDDQLTLQADQKDTLIKERTLKAEDKIKRQKKKNRKTGQLSRSGSMDSGVFLLKMFFPISLDLKRTSTAGKRSKVSPRPSLDGSEKEINKGWGKIRLLVMGESKNSGSSSLAGSTSSGSSSRHDDINYTPSCWSFHKKYRSSKQRGCLL